MDDFKRGDLVRRRSDDLLMEIEYVEQDLACCYIIEPFMPPRKIVISLDAVVLEHKAESFSRDLDK
ncbi:hypothetical protein TK34_11115 [Aeromonas hydrophila]|nr:hypothetical protein TK34_11115 [Aeromonas hydrophila]